MATVNLQLTLEIAPRLDGRSRDRRRGIDRERERERERERREREGERVLQGAAQRGGAILLHFGGSPGPFACSKMSLFYLKTCTPAKATP